jgi:hypothetical protein
LIVSRQFCKRFNTWLEMVLMLIAQVVSAKINKILVYPCTLEIGCQAIDSINYHQHQENIWFVEHVTMQFSQASKVTTKTLLEIKPI